MSIHLESEVIIVIPIDFAWKQSVGEHLYQIHPDVIISKVAGYPNLERQFIPMINTSKDYLNYGVERLLDHSEKIIYARRFGTGIKYSTAVWVYEAGENSCETRILNIQDVELESEATVTEQEYKKIMEESIKNNLLQTQKYLENEYSQAN